MANSNRNGMAGGNLKGHLALLAASLAGAAAIVILGRKGRKRD